MNKLYILRCIASILGVATVLTFGTVNAQVSTSFQMLDEADLSLEWMTAHLSLTPEDLYAITVLNTRYAVRFDSIRISNEDRITKVSRTRRVKQQRDNELKYILSEEQFTMYHYHHGQDDSAIVKKE